MQNRKGKQNFETLQNQPKLDRLVRFSDEKSYL